MKLKDLTRDVLVQAVDVYLDEAYGGATPPEAVRARLAWPPGDDIAALLANDSVFERTPHDCRPDACTHLRLRLGNPKYPHMKLGLDRVPDTGDWVLVVDTHDALLARAVAEEEQHAFQALVAHNAELKGRIERRWTAAGLPTFEQYVRAALRRRAKGDAG